jgi:hypothetical protein
MQGTTGTNVGGGVNSQQGVGSTPGTSTEGPNQGTTRPGTKKNNQGVLLSALRFRLTSSEARGANIKRGEPRNWQFCNVAWAMESGLWKKATIIP